MIRPLVTAATVVATVFSLSACAPDPEAVPEEAPAASSFQMPVSETVRLDNGLTLMLMPQTEVPLITVNAVVRAGSIKVTGLDWRLLPPKVCCWAIIWLQRSRLSYW